MLYIDKMYSCLQTTVSHIQDTRQPLGLGFRSSLVTTDITLLNHFPVQWLFLTLVQDSEVLVQTPQAIQVTELGKDTLQALLRRGIFDKMNKSVQHQTLQRQTH